VYDKFVNAVFSISSIELVEYENVGNFSLANISNLTMSVDGYSAAGALKFIT